MATEEQRKARQVATLIANPYLSKGMLKPTGFERDFIEPALSIEEQQIELEHYSSEHSICERVETAVLRYKMNRKFHQNTLSTFHAFLNFAGFDERPSSFTGGTSKEDAEDLSKEEKARRKQVNYMSKQVSQSVENDDGKWVVDFKGVTKGFFSTCFPTQFLFHDDPEHDKKVTNAACNVIRNFFNYLLFHNVCAEYTDQIREALSTFEGIESELVKLAEVQSVFPGDFSKACSILCGGYYAKSQYQGNWMDGDVATDPNNGLTAKEAKWVACAGIAAFASSSKNSDLDLSAELKIVNTEEEVGLEVVAITLPMQMPEETQEFFSKLKGTFVAPMGKLLCKRYHFQHAAPLDLPFKDASDRDSFEFVLDEGSLQKCYPGLKIIATVKETNAGLNFIDYWSECYGTFYTWRWNDKAKDYKEGINPLKPANPKSHPLSYSDITPVDKNRMLEYEALAAEHDFMAEASKIAHIPQSNGRDARISQPSHGELNLDTHGDTTGTLNSSDNGHLGQGGLVDACSCEVNIDNDAQDNAEACKKTNINEGVSESRPLISEHSGIAGGTEDGSDSEVVSDQGLFSDEEGSEMNDD